MNLHLLFIVQSNGSTLQIIIFWQVKGSILILYYTAENDISKILGIFCSLKYGRLNGLCAIERTTHVVQEWFFWLKLNIFYFAFSFVLPCANNFWSQACIKWGKFILFFWYKHESIIILSYLFYIKKNVTSISLSWKLKTQTKISWE